MRKLRSLRFLVSLGSCILVACAAPCVAQQIKVRLINGKSGRAVADQNVTVIWNAGGQSVIRVNRQGEGIVSLPSGTTAISLIAGPKKGKEPGRIPYSTCDGNATVLLDVARIMESGVSPDNRCSKNIHIAPRAGEVIYYILPLPWFYIDMQ